jgi:RNA-directed DNA polymerase
MPSEFKNTKESIEFLGYNIAVDKVGIKPKSEQRIKKQISYLLYRNLIQPIKDKPFRGVEFPSNGKDKDFLRAIMQVRRYLYGNLSEANLRKYIVGAHKRLTFKGIMSFYPLIDDVDQLKSLDRWLLSTILNVLNKRKKLFLGHGYSVPNGFPFNQSADQLLKICKETVIYDKKGLMEIPSFLRIHKAIQKGLTNDGIEKVMNPGSKTYYED